jgi:hypothetical protein
MAAAALATGIAAATSLYADDSGNTKSHGGIMMSPGMMDQGGMMPMTEQMSEMMDHCSQMMQGTGDGGSGVPNEQWQKDAPVTPENDG